MADFNIAVQITLKHEGGYVNSPNDSGGATNFGITQADMPGKDMKTLTVSEAVEYYREHYWKINFSQIVSQDIANKLFDMGVLFGVNEAAYLLQRALNFIPQYWTKTFDEYTLQATNLAVTGSLLNAYKDHLRTHALNVANANPNDRVFLTGWLNRINS
jgi:lysozyme family protein